MTCEKHTEVCERIKGIEIESQNNKTFIQDVHDDHEKTKVDVSKNKQDIAMIKLWVILCSGVGSYLGNITPAILKYISEKHVISQTVSMCKYVWFVFFPDSYAGN